MDEDKSTLQWQLKTLNQKQDLLKGEITKMGDRIVGALEAVNVTLKQSLELQKYIPLFKKVAEALETLPSELEFHSKILEEVFLTVDESKHRHSAMSRQAKMQMGEILQQISGTPLETAIRGMVDPEFLDEKVESVVSNKRRRREAPGDSIMKLNEVDVDKGIDQLFGRKPKLLKEIKKMRAKQKEKTNG